MKRALALAALAALVLPSPTGPLVAQSGAAAPSRTAPARDSLARPVPFGPGERLEYQVKLGVFSAGKGWIALDRVDTVQGRPAYHLNMGIDAGTLFLKVRDDYQSWLDTRAFVSRRFISDVHEVSYKNFKEFMIYPEERRWQQIDEQRSGDFDTAEPLDELSFVFWLRTLPLVVGETYTSDRYFRRDGNPVVVRVLRKEVKEVPAGKFNTIVVQPTIRTKGLFSEGGKAEIYLSDDAARQIVYLRTDIPGAPGSITLHLKSVRPGTPLNPVRGAPTGASEPHR